MASPTLVFNLSQVSNGSWSCRAASKLTSLTFASSQEGGHWPLDKTGEKLEAFYENLSSKHTVCVQKQKNLNF